MVSASQPGPPESWPSHQRAESAADEDPVDAAGSAGAPTGTRLWLVTTANSEYTLDFDAGLARRTPITGGELRRDGDWVSLLELQLLAVGSPMVLWLQIRDDGLGTVRITTPVVRIQRVPNTSR